MILTVNGKGYTIKYGIEATAKSNIIGTLVNLEELDVSPANLSKITLGISEFLLVGLQNKHSDEFGYDLDTEEGKSEALSKVCSLLDEYSDQGENLLELYGLLNEEMTRNGFLKSLLEKAKEQAEKKTPKKSTKKVVAIEEK